MYIHPETSKVACGGENYVFIEGYCYTNVQLSNYTKSMKLYVLPLPKNSSFDVILEELWLLPSRAALRYDRRALEFSDSTGKRWRLPCDTLRSYTMRVLTSTQLRREIEKGDRLFICYAVSQGECDADSAEKRSNIRGQKLVAEFQTIFEPLPNELPPRRGIRHTINTGINPPLSKALYRLYPKEKRSAEKLIQDCLDKGWICFCHSPYSSPYLVC